MIGQQVKQISNFSKYNFFRLWFKINKFIFEVERYFAQINQF